VSGQGWPVSEEGGKELSEELWFIGFK
jgi:hypothetical protein